MTSCAAVKKTMDGLSIQAFGTVVVDDTGMALNSMSVDAGQEHLASYTNQTFSTCFCMVVLLWPRTNSTYLFTSHQVTGNTLLPSALGDTHHPTP